MRVWDVSPGYLSDRSLLGEHVELHAIFSILRHGKAGYSRHPEVLRWKGHLAALARRHDWLCAELSLRGFVHRSPLPRVRQPVAWPPRYLLTPGDQLRLLRRKYGGRRRGRLPLPRAARSLWRQHERSVRLRSFRLWRDLDRRVREGLSFEDLAVRLVRILRRPPDPRIARRLPPSSAPRSSTAAGEPA